jgi:hypothetical protein
MKLNFGKEKTPAEFISRCFFCLYVPEKINKFLSDHKNYFPNCAKVCTGFC